MFDLINFTIAAPLLALAAGALVVLLLDLLLPARTAHSLWYLFSLLSVALAGYYLTPLWGKGLTGFDGGLVMDQFGLVFSGILLGVCFLTLLLSFSRTELDKSGYLALVLWATMGMLVMSTAGSLMTLFLGLELLSLALYVAVAFDPVRPTAREAALKYFVLGAVASGFILFGFALLYGVAGGMNLTEIAAAAPEAIGDLYYKAGIALSLVGLAFKMALVPFHVWAPDVYQGAPTAVTAFMAVGTKTAAFAGLVRFLVSAVPAEQQATLLFPLAVLAAASMILGSTVGIWQNDLKRLMAYSGIAHAGYLVMALPGLGTEGLTAGAFYLAAYAFTAMGVFAIIALLEAEGKDGADLRTFAGMLYQRPVLAACLALLMFGLAGLPPTGGLIGKILLAKAALGANAWLLLIALIVSTGISAYVYLRVVGATIQKPAQAAATARAVMAGAQEDLAFSPGVVRAALYAVLAISVIGTVWMGVLPGSFLSLMQAIVAL
ncbi:MAG TPA: NADH-quinone oxidoreductase subunit N [Symbiobacteriaceae bacterium]